MSGPSIDVAIITRLRRDHVRSAVRSALADGPRDVLVIENGCPEGSTVGLSDEFPAVRWHRSDTNLGVAGGRNLALSLSTAPLVVFLDDDAELRPGSIEAVRSAFDTPTVGAVAMRIDNPRTGKPLPHEFPARDSSHPSVEADVTYFVGAGFALRRAALDRSGQFDEWLFYAGEELDLSYRLLDSGWRIRYVPDASVVHHGAKEGRPAGQSVYYHLRNRWRVAWRRLPLPFAVSQSVLWTGFFLLRAVRTGALGHFCRGLRDGVAAVPEAWRSRTPIDGTTVRYLKEHDGRLWY